MTLSLTQDAGGALPSRMLTPTALWKQSGVPRDLIYAAIHSAELLAYDMGSPKRPRFMVKQEDFQTWMNTRRVQGKVDTRGAQGKMDTRRVQDKK